MWTLDESLGLSSNVSLKIVSGIWHVKAYDSYKWKLAGCLWRHCTLSLVVWHPLKAAAWMVPCCHGARQKKLTPGGNESSRGLVPLDLCTRGALDFKVKLPEYMAVHGGEWGEQRMERSSGSQGPAPLGHSGIRQSAPLFPTRIISFTLTRALETWPGFH